MWLVAGMLGAMIAGVALAGFATSPDMEDVENDPAEEDESLLPTSEGPALSDMVDLAYSSSPEPANTATTSNALETNAPGDAPRSIEGSLKNDIIAGSDFDDLLYGYDGADQLNGYAGNDQLQGGEGSDDLHGSEGTDTLFGAGGNDTLNGGEDGDLLQGGSGDDQLLGGLGNDTLQGEGDNDTLHGGDGQDILQGGSGNDALHGGLAADALYGGDGEDTLFGGWGDDTLDGSGDAAVDFLNGGGGADQITFGSGDVISAGAEGDWLIGAEDVTSAHVMDFETGLDTLVLVYDDSAGPAPTLTVSPDAADPDDMIVFLDGEEVALLHGVGEFAEADIRLIPQSLI